jgi:hypothetical protein
MKLQLVLTGVCALSLLAATASAQEAGAPGGGGAPAGRGGRGMRGGDPLFGVVMQSLRQWDTNKNGQLEKEEIDAAMPAFLQRIKESQALLVKAVDKNGDGKLDDQERAELTKLMQAADLLRSLQPLKTDKEDKSLLLTDEEINSLPQRLTEMADRLNKMMSQRPGRRNNDDKGEKPAPAPVTP